MQRVIILMCLVLALSGCEKEVKVVSVDKIQDRNGTAYLPNSTTPFAGRAEDYYDNGQLKYEAIYTVKDEFKGRPVKELSAKDEFQEKLVKEFYRNGQLKSLHFAGLEEIVDQKWYKNGRIEYERIWTPKDWFLDSSVETFFYKSGRRKSESSLNEEDGRVLQVWYENGQLKQYAPMKDDKAEGLVREWSEDGQLMSEIIYKEGRPTVAPSEQ